MPDLQPTIQRHVRDFEWCLDVGLFVFDDYRATAPRRLWFGFDDASGDRLRAWMGIDKAAFYDPEFIAILPMGLCYPGRLKNGGDAPPRKECAPLWHARLLDLLRGLVADAAVVGGVDSLCHTTLYGFNALQLVANSAFQLWFGSLPASTLGARAVSEALLAPAERRSVRQL